MPAQILNHLRWRGGDNLVVELTERNTIEIRPLVPADLSNVKVPAMALPPSGTNGR